MKTGKNSKKRKNKRFDLINIILVLLSALILAAIIYKVYVMLAPSNELRKDTKALKENQLDFDKLKSINPDICAWIVMDNTRIDYPVVQGTNNMEYLNKNAYGDSAVYGALFLDTRNDKSFGDPYSIIYGHHMQGGNMFGDIDRYRDERFFRKNKRGKLYTPSGKYKLNVLAIMTVSCDDKNIYDPDIWTYSNITALKKDISSRAMYKRRLNTDNRLLALSTCYGDDSKQRSVLILEITEPFFDKK